MKKMDRTAERRRGATMIVVLGALVSLIAVSSLAIDLGIVWAARTQLQNAADAAALAGAAKSSRHSEFRGSVGARAPVSASRS